MSENIASALPQCPKCLGWHREGDDCIMSPSIMRATISDLRQRLEAAERERDEARRQHELAASAQTHRSGVWRCAKCNFRLVQSTLYAASGTIGPRDEPGDKCPNDGSPLWRVSWKDECQEAEREWDKQVERAQAAESALERAMERIAELEGSEPLRRFMDAIDAYSCAREWIEESAKADSGPHRQIRNLTFAEEDGGLLVYSFEDRPRAVAVVLRDTWNYSVAFRMFPARSALAQSEEGER